MAEEVSSEAHGALRRALFLDVPYILDSLWRWGEFRTNRLGSVRIRRARTTTCCGLPGKAAPLRCLRSCACSPSSAPHLMRCARCGASEFAANIRFIVSTLLIVAALMLFTRVLNAVTFYLMRRAENPRGRTRAARKHAATVRSQTWRRPRKAPERRLHAVRVAIDRRAEASVGNLGASFVRCANAAGQ